MNANDYYPDVSHPIAKIVTAWLAALGLSSWGNLASMMAAAYTALLIADWVWKRFGRRFAENKGWVKRRRRRRSDNEPR
jgi:hypothetical protein